MADAISYYILNILPYSRHNYPDSNLLFTNQVRETVTLGLGNNVA